jgi:AcrR family transcriptional regulator
VAAVYIAAYVRAVTAKSDYHHGNLRRALLDAALALFAERARFDFTMRELARAADVTHSAPYRHFADRWALLDALAAEGFVLLRERVLSSAAAAASSRDDDPRVRIARLGEGYVRFAAEHPHHFRLMFLRPIPGASPELSRAARASFAPLAEAIEGARARGLLRSGLRTQEVAVAAWSLVHGVASLVAGGQLSASQRGMRARIDALTSVFLDGAFAAPGRG